MQAGTSSVNAEHRSAQAVFGALMASTSGVAEEARTRDFAAPTFAGCAFVVGLGSSELQSGTGQHERGPSDFA